MNRATRRGLNRAVRAAYLSDLYSHRVGAALFRKSILISVGWNSLKTHPKCPTKFSRHAEFNVFIGLSRIDVSGCTLFIARITRTNRIGIAKPCIDCQEFLAALGLKNIFYTTQSGRIELL